VRLSAFVPDKGELMVRGTGASDSQSRPAGMRETRGQATSQSRPAGMREICGQATSQSWSAGVREMRGQATSPSWPGGADRAPKKMSRSLLSKRGGVVGQENVAKHPFRKATGGSNPKKKRFDRTGSTAPSRGKEASRLFLVRSIRPAWPGGARARQQPCR
jgi:hypothetical protein